MGPGRRSPGPAGGWGRLCRHGTKKVSRARFSMSSVYATPFQHAERWGHPRDCLPLNPAGASWPWVVQRCSLRVSAAQEITPALLPRSYSATRGSQCFGVRVSAIDASGQIYDRRGSCWFSEATDRNPVKTPLRLFRTRSGEYISVPGQGIRDQLLPRDEVGGPPRLIEVTGLGWP